MIAHNAFDKQPGFTPPTGAIRQQFDIGTFDNNGLEIISFEMSPNYFMTRAPNLTLGVGPGVGYAKASYMNGPTEG
jgi:outer membrane scaffolding protein for murein synthesis (MipA/OmpV family)